MIFSRRLVASLLFCALAFAPGALAATKGKPTRPADDDPGSYKGAIVMDAATGNILFERNADEVSPPASMTKLMTFAVLHDKLQSGNITLDTPVRITVEDAKIGGTQVFLDSRETFSVEELVYAMMIESANDAAHALAHAACGSVEACVEAMNAKAAELGMTHTTFRTPHGLPPSSRRIADGDLTTPRDFAVLCRYVVTHTDVLKYTSVAKRDFAPDRKFGETQHMENHNKLLGKVTGVDGLKTGYTTGAGYCLSATALRNGHRIIVVIMGSFGPNGLVDKGHSRDIKTIGLIERGFAAIPPNSPVFAGAGPIAQPAAAPVASSPLTLAPTPAGQNSAAPASTASPASKFNIPGAKKK
jgi:D-alanyl-D-alanine carboxypeptidase